VAQGLLSLISSGSTKTARDKNKKSETLLHKQASDHKPRESGASFFPWLFQPSGHPHRLPLQSFIEHEDAAMKSTALVTVAFIALVAWAGNRASIAGDGRSVTAVNGSVEASAGQVYDKVKTVNGDVTVRTGATVESAQTVNGEIELERDAKAGSVSTVNGSLDIGDGATVAREASTVNGSLKLAKRTRVGGAVSTVSGEIELNGAEVGGTLTTVNGDIDLTDGAHVRGGILVKKPNGDWSWNNGHEDLVKVHICGTCVVDGDLRFERPVELRVDAGAKIGKVIGDQVTRK
jgi:hypothetical protein